MTRASLALLAGLLLAAVILAINYAPGPAPSPTDPAVSVRHPPPEAPWTYSPPPTAVTATPPSAVQLTRRRVAVTPTG